MKMECKPAGNVGRNELHYRLVPNPPISQGQAVTQLGSEKKLIKSGYKITFTHYKLIGMKLLFILLFVFLSFISFGQKSEIGKAITTEGRRIFLYDDGTWKYELEPTPVTRGTIIPDTAENLFNKPVGGQYQKSPYNKKVWLSNRTHFSVWYNSKKWRMNLLHNIPPVEVSFHFIDNVCTILTERVDVDMETWIYETKLFRKQNSPSMKIMKEEWRTVNGLSVYFMQWQTGDNRSNLQCYTYFGKGSTELVQMTVSAPVSVVYDSEEEIFRLLNGLVLEKK